MDSINLTQQPMLLVTFYTSYLKCYYPAEFMAALLTLEKDNTDKVVRYVDEVKRLNLELFPPDINKSDLVFFSYKHKWKRSCYVWNGAIKGAGDVVINSILTAKKRKIHWFIRFYFKNWCK